MELSWSLTVGFSIAPKVKSVEYIYAETFLKGIFGLYYQILMTINISITI